MNTEQFINKAIQLHGDKYDYSKAIYTKAINKVIIICKKHGEFYQQSNLHLSGSGCVNCFRDRNPLLHRCNREQFINKAMQVHGNKYDYSKVIYTKSDEKIIIICKEHGEYLQTPSKHLQGGCQLCGFTQQSKTRSKSKDKFINDAIKVHGDKYDYSKVDYLGMNVKITIICKKHGDFILYPIKYLHRKQECPKCLLIKKYSKVSISYLDFISKLYNIKINHGENSSEFKIPNSKFKADGYCEETNTIYEFHGTIYHGDPRCCNSLEYNYFGKNYGELYKKTLEREQLIRDLGYNLVVMWEHDWNNINKSIKILQRKFCSNR